LIALAGLILLALIAEAAVLAELPGIDPRHVGAFFGSFTLVLAVFVALADEGWLSQLRSWAAGSSAAALGLPALLLVPYFVFALGTGTFSARGAGKLLAYIAVPTLLLFPDRNGKAERVGWRDFAAMLALGLPVAANWLRGIWLWPEELYFFRPLYSALVGGYAFMVLRNLEGVGYKLLCQKQDLARSFLHFLGYSAMAIPLGLWLGFIHPHHHPGAPATVRLHAFGNATILHLPPEASFLGQFLFQFVGIYITIAIPEELLFRGILQNFLTRSFRSERREAYGLWIASIVFGASHLHHAPVPNWRYGILATLAGLFYGNVFRTRRRISASALTHTLVDTAWHFWF
jgi:membrane protease YdiL (CAAX protease family)